MALTDKLSAIADAIRGKTGGTEKLTFAEMPLAIAGIEAGGGGAKVTEYVVTEDADRSLWLNSLGIKLVRGVNIIATGWLDNKAPVNNRSGLTTLIVIIWGGVAGSVGMSTTYNIPIRTFYACTNGYNLASSWNHLAVGNTSKINVAEDGALTLTTSATGVTIGNYNNSFIGAGNTYYLLQAESEVVC